MSDDDKGVPDDQEPGTLEFFQQWMATMQERMLETKPEPLPKGSELAEEWTATTLAWKRADQDIFKFNHEVNMARGRKDPNLKKLEQELRDKQAHKYQLFVACREKAQEMLATPRVAAFVEGDDDDLEWVTWAALKYAKPEDLAAFCEENPDLVEPLVELFKDTDLLRQILLAGGVKGSWGKFLQLYNTIKEGDTYQEKVGDYPVLGRMALAISLELATPIHFFDTHTVVDPIARYINYETAYLEGELDAMFPTLTVTELRMVVDSQATPEDLDWIRKCLQQYRPDWMLTDDEEKRYCGIIWSDVGFRDPKWTYSPKTYEQILDGGGKCGPQSWFGRFLLKAFGVPTWGIIYPGHACLMQKMKSEGWRINLGAKELVDKSSWRERPALDFYWETLARATCETELDYQKKVQRLEWASLLFDDPAKTYNIQKCNGPHPACLNLSLAFHYKNILARGCTREQRLAPRFPSEGIVTKLETFKENLPTECGEVTCDADNGQITIPADATSTERLKIMPSFSGGQQAWYEKDIVVEYAIPADCVTASGSYQVVFRYATVHRLDTGLELRVETADQEPQECTVGLSHTIGQWEETEPVTVELSGETKLFVTRTYKDFGMSIYNIQLTPA